MARDGSGGYDLPAGNPVVTGTTISSTVHNNTMNDLASEMANSTDKDGQTVITGDFDHNGNKIILDADGDTSITSDTDDIIHFEVEAVDALTFGWQGVADTGFITVDPKAFTADATENTHRLAVLSSNAITIPSGTTPLVTAVYVTEPNITATGTVTVAATMYIKAAPTEGATNYALWVDAGDVQLDGGLTVTGTTALGTVTAGTTTVGTFTSTGIDDNATEETFQLEDNVIKVGVDGSAHTIVHVSDTDSLGLRGGTTNNQGAGLRLYGGSTPTVDSDIQFTADGSNVLYYNSGDNDWDFQAKDIKTTGTTTTAELNIATGTAPASAGAAGTAGDVAWDASFIYICIATNTWERAAIASW